MFTSPKRSSIIFCVLVIGLVLLPFSAAAGDLDREQKCVERDVTLDELPPAVKAVILEAAGAHKIRELEEVTRPDGIVYEAEWLVDEKEFEIEVTADGTVLDGDDEADDVDDVDDAGDKDGPDDDEDEG